MSTFHTWVDSDVHILMLLFAGSGTAGQMFLFSLQMEEQKKNSSTIKYVTALYNNIKQLPFVFGETSHVNDTYQQTQSEDR